MTIRVVDLELTRPAPDVTDLHGCGELRILARHHGRPVGWVSLPVEATRVPSGEIARAARRQLAWELLPRTMAERLSPRTTGEPPMPPMSVVVCTRDRASLLEGCLAALAALDYPEYDVVVVDNGSGDEATRRLADRHGFRCVREETPGLDRARNQGIRAARHELVAFTDDDARPDRGWLRGFARAFEDDTVDVATGMVAPAELETEAQILFEDVYGGMGKGFESWVVRPEELDRRGLLWASAFGCGANMAFRKRAFQEVGGFDPGLDVGTPTAGAGDVEMVHRALARGLSVAYEPSALVWHLHRRTFRGLGRQLFDNGRSFGAYLLTCARKGTVPLRSVVLFWMRSWLGAWILRRLLRPGRLPRRMVVKELAGGLYAPLAYLATRRRERRLCTAGALPPPLTDGGLA